MNLIAVKSNPIINSLRISRLWFTESNALYKSNETMQTFLFFSAFDKTVFWIPSSASIVECFGLNTNCLSAYYPKGNGVVLQKQ